MISNRSKLSLCQYLMLHDFPFLRLLIAKHGLELSVEIGMPLINALHNSILSATPEQLISILEELVRTQNDLRNCVSPRYRHDERWHDLSYNLQLDGYLIEGNSLRDIDPSIEGFESLEDDLTKELRRSGLDSVNDILTLLNNSAEDFRKTPPDYNGCLGNVRIALETLGRSIARARQTKYPGSFDENKWGQVLAYLRISDLISENHEKGISGVYSFVSPGSHRPVVLSEQEEKNRGRTLTLDTPNSRIYISNENHHFSS
jgi:hypothetical protein